MENGLQYTAAQHSLMAMMFAFALGVHIVGAVYFAHTQRVIAPRYRMATIMSLMVMLASGTLFLRLGLSWQSAFAWDGAAQLWVQADALFDNTLRYINWAVTIPILACQFTFLVGMPREQVVRTRTILVASGVAMVVTGLVGQLYETTDTGALLLWGAISTIPFIPLLLVMLRELERGRGRVPAEAAQTLRNVQLLILFAWGLYPLAYLIPAVAEGPAWAVTRQGMFTAADVLSKVIYGVLLAKVARIRSAADGFGPAVELESARLDEPVAALR